MLIVVHPTQYFFEVKFFNVYIFCTPEVQLKATNILVTKDNILHRKHIYLRKKIKVPFSSPMLRYFVTAPEPLDTTVCCKNQWLWNKYICTTVELVFWRIKNNKAKVYRTEEQLLQRKKWQKIINITITESTENVHHVASQNLHFVHTPYNKNKN